MTERGIKTAYHALLAAVALMELRHAKTPFRKAVVTAWAGFHLSLAYADWMDGEEPEKPTKAPVIMSSDEVDYLLLDPRDFPSA